jgi:hypothetical protein
MFPTILTKNSSYYPKQNLLLGLYSEDGVFSEVLGFILQCFRPQRVDIVAYFLKERTVEPEKQPLLGNVRTQQ